MVSNDINKYIENSKIRGKLCRWENNTVNVLITPIVAGVNNKEVMYSYVEKAILSWNQHLKTNNIAVQFQTTEYPGITRSAPNLYSLFNLHYVEIAPWIKYSLTILTIALSVLIVIHKKKKQQKYTNNDFVIKMTLLSLLVPFFLPGMMDRYFYLANIFVILILSLFNYNDKKVFLLSGISFLAYSLPTIAIQCIGFGDLHQILLYVATIGNIYII